MSSSPQQADFEWDAGDRSCGELIIELRAKMQSMPPGSTLALMARDRSALPELHAWCRLTRHQLVEASPPYFLLQRRKDEP